MQTNEQIAVFLDIENFIGFCHSLKLPIELSEILEKLKEEGRIIIRRSFGDLVKSLSAIGQPNEADNVRRMLRDNLFIHEDIAYQNQFKNSADMRLAVEMLYTAFTVPTITKFAVIAGDSDYVPLFQKLQEQNKMVIGVSGSENGTAVIYRRACDSIYYFADITRQPAENVEIKVIEIPKAVAVNKTGFTKQEVKTVQAKPLTEKTTEPDVQAEVNNNGAASTESDLQSIRDEYANLLVRAVRILEQAGKDAVIQNLTQQMRQLQSDFNYERAGFEAFQDLIRFAADQNLVKVEQRDNQTCVFLPDAKIISGTTVSTAIYRKHIQERLKCQLPSSRIRNAICQKTFDNINYNIDDGGILLRDLSMDVTDGLADDGINVPQPEVYKYLFTLYRSRCFDFEDSEYGDFNPKIIGYNAQFEQWDNRFLIFQMKHLQNNKLPLFSQKLSSLFFDTEEKSLQIKQLLNKEGIKYEN